MGDGGVVKLAGKRGNWTVSPDSRDIR